MVVKALKSWSALQFSGEVFDPFLTCIFLAVVLKALRCHHSPDNMSFFPASIGMIKVAKKRGERGWRASLFVELGRYNLCILPDLFCWQPQRKEETKPEYKMVWCNIKLWKCGGTGGAVGRLQRVAWACEYFLDSLKSNSKVTIYWYQSHFLHFAHFFPIIPILQVMREKKMRPVLLSVSCDPYLLYFCISFLCCAVLHQKFKMLTSSWSNQPSQTSASPGGSKWGLCW